MKSDLFSQSVIDDYLHKIAKASTIKLLHEYRFSTEEWLSWLVSQGSIDQSLYRSLQRKITRSIEKRSRELQSSPTSFQWKRPLFILSIIFTFILIGAYVFDWQSAFQSSRDDLSIQTVDKRVLPFRGRIKNADGTGVDEKQDIYFAIYDSPTDGSLLYSGSCVGADGITPEYNGVFSVTLGTDCGMEPIPNSLFENNALLYLGVRIGTGTEIQPRYKISTSGYAQDAALLGGLPAGKLNSSIPYINEEGAIIIDAESPSLLSTNGKFTIQGRSLSLQTIESKGGDIMLQPGIGGNTIVTSGNFGVGDVVPETRLSIIGLEPYASIATIKNLASTDEDKTSVLNLGLATDVSGSNATFVNFYAGASKDANGELAGAIRLNNGSVIYETSGADIAEYFSVEDGINAKPGLIMTVAPNGIHAGVREEPVIGVVTNTAGYIGNSAQKDRRVLIGLIGQLSVLVSDIQGGLQTGDRVGLSQIPGYGALAIDDREIVGYVLRGMDDHSSDFSNQSCPDTYQAKKGISGKLIRCGMIPVFLRPR